MNQQKHYHYYRPLQIIMIKISVCVYQGSSSSVDSSRTRPLHPLCPPGIGAADTGGNAQAHLLLFIQR